MDKESKDKLIALSIAFLLTAMFAIPYFYIQYFNKPEIKVAKGEQGKSVLASIIQPIKGFGENFADIFKGEVYIKE